MSLLLTRVRLLPLYFDVARRMGWDWVAYRLWYALKRKSGQLVSGSPVAEWAPVIPTAWRPPNIVQVSRLQGWLRDSYSAKQIDDLRAVVSNLQDRRFVVFGEAVTLQDWHHDPYGDVRYPSDIHWSLVPEHPEADLKRVWEPSRFSWALDLVRAEMLLPELGAGELFWELLEEWCDQNQPNQGVNWQCGQEASLRLLSISCAAMAMPELLTDQRIGVLQRLARVTADRVSANIGYAKSQRNNHYASESVGLLTASYLLGGSAGEEFWAKGQEHLAQMSDELIFADGGSSQYSTNYHRVFVQNLVWAERLALVQGRSLPEAVRSGLERSASFLDALVEPISGSGPFFGADDGARILPLDRVAHRDLAHDALVACASARVAPRAKFFARETEGLAWLGFDSLSNDELGPQGAWVESFPDAGLHKLGFGTTCAYVRCGSYQFRPAHEDQLHCDIWVDGVNIESDAGTQSYKPGPDEPGSLSEVVHHNSPHIDGKPLMPRVGRFLKARWCEGSASAVDADETRASGSFSVRLAGGQKFDRRITVTRKSVGIEDESSPSIDFVSVWDSFGSATFDSGSVQIEVLRAKSETYGQSEKRPGVIVRSNGSSRGSWITVGPCPDTPNGDGSSDVTGERVLDPKKGN